MKKIIILLTPIVLLAIVFGCDKDHDSPTYSTYSQLASPADVVATYDTADDAVDVSWTMGDMSDVINFVLTVSDSSLFDKGNVRMFSTNVDVNSAPFSTVYDASVHVDADLDSVIMYFTVSAVFKNDTFNYFTGPRAEIDSALVIRK